MSPHPWSLLNVCAIIKHASAVFYLQIPLSPLQRLVGEMHSIYKIAPGKSAYFFCSRKHNAKWSGVGHARKALTHLGMP